MASLDVAAVSVVLTFTAAVGQSGCGAFLRVSVVQNLREPLDADAAAGFQTLAVESPQLWRDPAKNSRGAPAMELL